MQNLDLDIRTRLVLKVVRCLSRDLSTLQGLAEARNLTKIGVEELVAAGFISSSQLVKILGNGSLTVKLEVAAHAFSKSAEEAIKAVGGTVAKL